MKLIRTGKQGGKTTEIIKQAAKSGGYIVCTSHQEAVRIAKQAQEMKCSIPFPITFDDFIQKRFHPTGVKKFHIDNADWLLQYIAGPVPVKTVSFDIDDHPGGAE